MWHQSDPSARHPIALAVSDPDLAEALAEAIEAHPALVAVNLDDTPDLIIADRELPGAPSPVLRLDVGPLPADAPPDLVVSAALVMAAGFRLEPAPAERPPVVELTPRVREVLAMMVDGAPNKLIARALGISASTAKFHVAAILHKLGARNRAEAVAIALREGRVVL
jgi:DNA-binding CsgD family transcriptional regulator